MGPGAGVSLLRPFWLSGEAPLLPAAHLFFLLPVTQLSTRVPSHGDTPSMYCEAKLAARTYQSVKQQLFRAFQKAGLGTWVRKPPEQDQFLLTL